MNYIIRPLPNLRKGRAIKSVSVNLGLGGAWTCKESDCIGLSLELCDLSVLFGAEIFHRFDVPMTRLCSLKINVCKMVLEVAFGIGTSS